MLERTYFAGSMPLHTPSHNLEACGGPGLSPLPQFLWNVVEKVAQEGGSTTYWRPIMCSLPRYIYKGKKVAQEGGSTTHWRPIMCSLPRYVYKGKKVAQEGGNTTHWRPIMCSLQR